MLTVSEIKKIYEDLITEDGGVKSYDIEKAKEDLYGILAAGAPVDQRNFDPDSIIGQINNAINGEEMLDKFIRAVITLMVLTLGEPIDDNIIAELNKRPCVQSYKGVSSLDTAYNDKAYLLFVYHNLVSANVPWYPNEHDGIIFSIQPGSNEFYQIGIEFTNILRLFFRAKSSLTAPWDKWSSNMTGTVFAEADASNESIYVVRKMTATNIVVSVKTHYELVSEAKKTVSDVDWKKAYTKVERAIAGGSTAIDYLRQTPMTYDSAADGDLYEVEFREVEPSAGSLMYVVDGVNATVPGSGGVNFYHVSDILNGYKSASPSVPLDVYQSAAYAAFSAAVGDGSMVSGKNTLTDADAAFATGEGTIASADNQTVVGQYNEIDDDALFVVGNGSDDEHRSNAITVKKNGEVYAHGDKRVAMEETVVAIQETVREMNEGANATPENVLDLSEDEVHNGFYLPNGSLNTTTWGYAHTFIPCAPGDVFYTNISIDTNLTITFFNATKEFVTYVPYYTNTKITVPDNDNIAYMSIPLMYGKMALYVVSHTPITDKYVKGTLSGASGVSYTDFYKKINVNKLCVNQEDVTITVSDHKNTALIIKEDVQNNNYWCAFATNITNATVYGMTIPLLILAYRGDSVVCYNFSTGEVIKLSTNNTTGAFSVLATYPLELTTYRNGNVFNISYGNTVTITSLSDGTKVEIPLYNYIDSGYQGSFGCIWRSINTVVGRKYRIYVDCTSVVSEPVLLTHNQWEGKKWYAYGTSITNIDREGKYAKYLRDFSGMQLTNKGISGGGIGDLGGYSHGQVYEAICNVTDGKLEADIITLETGANDTGAAVPYGTIYDTGRDTLAGCLNDCLRYLQANTDAQIVVIQSPVTTTKPNAANKYYEWAFMVEQICKINRVHFISSNNNMGYGKLTSENGSLYVVDMIHQTELGGYIFAENIWYQLRNIPTFKTQI